VTEPIHEIVFERLAADGTPSEIGRRLTIRPQAPPAVQRRVSSRGGIVVARQRIHVGTAHASATVDIHATDTTWRILLDNEQPAEVPRNTRIPVARFKVRKPEPPRRPGRSQ